MTEYDWMAFIGNFHKERMSYDILSRILGQEGADYRTSGRFYLDIMQADLIFGVEIWVISPCIGKVMGGFHNKMDWRISGKKPWQWADRSWDYPPLEEAMREAFLEDIKTYIYRCQNTDTKYIAMLPTIELCM